MPNLRRTLFALSLFFMFSGSAFAAHGWHHFWKIVATTDYIQVGTGKTIVYDFFDPNCSYCAQAFQREVPFIQSGQLMVRFVPVAVLTPSSMGKSATILESRNPPSALASDLMGALRAGTGAASPITPTLRTLSGINRNLQILLLTGNDLVPDLVFRLPDGHVGMIRGLFPQYALMNIVSGKLP